MKRALLLALLPALAFAQSAPSKDKEAVTFNEIERGPYFGAGGGWLFLLSAPNGGPFSPGQTAQVEIGANIGERLSVGGFFEFSANRASATYLGNGNGTASGDFSAFIAGASVRGNLVGFNDSQDVRRTWIYIRGGAGYTMFSPKQLLSNSDILVFAGPGVEYYTRLRHFSVAIDLTGSFLLTSGSLGVAVTPNVRYAF